MSRFRRKKERPTITLRDCGSVFADQASFVSHAAAMASLMVEGRLPDHPLVRGGRKAHQLDSEPTG